MGQRLPEDRLQVTHAWARPGVQVPPVWDVSKDLPWLAGKMYRGEAVVVGSIDDIRPKL